MTRGKNPELVPAAGALVWRRRRSRIEVALVHRSRYDDWSWPKGKLDPGETFAQAAAREVLEETGLQVRLGIPLPELVYGLDNGATKLVRYWAAQVVGGSGVLEHEVDEVRWLDVETARRTLTYARDRLPSTPCSKPSVTAASRRGRCCSCVTPTPRRAPRIGVTTTPVAR